MHDSRIRRARRRNRRGSVLILSAVLMIVMMGAIALSVDTGYMYTMQAQLDRAVDSAALAGATELVNGQLAANSRAVEYLARNPVGSGQFILDEDELERRLSEFREKYEEEIDVAVGNWNTDTGQFETTNELPSAVRVTMRYPQQPLFFARIFGQKSFDITSEAIARYQPRDIALVLDFSASMNDDSDLASINRLGFSAIHNNLFQMWDDLGRPQYGNLTFEPDWVTIPGTRTSARVRWRSTHVDVTASSNFRRCKLYYANGRRQTFSCNTRARTFSGTGSNYGQRIVKCKVKVGSKWETVDFYKNSHIKRGLGLNGVSYPYASGSWDDLINYCRSHNSSMPYYDHNVYAAGYRRKFGVLCLINYWNRYKPRKTQTADLWKASAQPITAVKNSVDIFLDYVGAGATEDRVAFSLYNSNSGEAKLEKQLTNNLAQVMHLVRRRQAGHYHSMTNIAAGMRRGRIEMDQRGRIGAFRMMVLMTDGQANWVNGSYNPTLAKQRVIDEAHLAKNRGYPIMTISLGANADSDLMQDVADITKGVHFNIPGGQTVAEYSDELNDVFRRIAQARPLTLVR